MDIVELKRKIETNTLSSEFFIMVYHDTDFVCNQYYRRIAKNKHKEIEFIESLEAEIATLDDIFGYCPPETLKIYKCDKFTFNDSRLNDLQDVIVVCKSIDKTLASNYKNVIDIPKLEQWQIKDYAYSICEGVENKNIDKLIASCPDIYKLTNELQKLNIFDNNRNNVFCQCLSDGVFSDLSTYTIYDFTNAVVSKDLKTLITIYQERFNIDIEPAGVLTIMLKKFKLFLDIRLGKNVTAEQCGVSSGMYYYGKKDSGIYSATQILCIYEQLLDVERKWKSGILPMEYMIDYIVGIILSN